MSDPVDADALLAEQVDYYRARAPEYDEVYERRGRYEHKQEEVNRQWLDEIEEVKYALDAFRPSGHVLELAPGTGEWTLQIARHAESITAVDASSEALAIAREKLAETSTPVRFVEADLFKWKPERRFDAVVFAFWLSHVPRMRFEDFLRLVSEALLPGGRFFFVDSAPVRWSTGEDVGQAEADSGISVRQLNDGRQFRIVKVYWSKKELLGRLRELGWVPEINTTARFFIFGQGKRG